MLQNISVFHFLVYAVLVGFIAAIIYTNIQRTALSKFITYLINNSCNSEENATGLDSIGLTAAEKRIISSAVIKMHGLKRCICIIANTDIQTDTLEKILEKKADNNKYFLKECNADELLKKYSFKTMPANQVILFIAALIIVAVAATSAVDLIISYVTTPKIENNDNAQIEENAVENKQENSSKNNNFEVDSPIQTQPEQTKPSGPRIPV